MPIMTRNMAAPTQCQQARCGGNDGLDQTSHENCIVRRAMVDEQVASGRFHIQRGLSRLGFGKQREPGKAIKLKNIKLSAATTDAVDGPKVEFDMKFVNEDFAQAYLWHRTFCLSLIASIHKRTKDLGVWRALKHLTTPSPWRGDALPMTSLTAIANYCKVRGSWSNRTVLSMNDNETC